MRGGHHGLRRPVHWFLSPIGTSYVGTRGNSSNACRGGSPALRDAGAYGLALCETDVRQRSPARCDPGRGFSCIYNRSFSRAATYATGA